MGQPYFVYILTNHTNTVLYTGVTNDIHRRVYEHRAGLSQDSFTKKYRLYKLVWMEEFAQPLEAIEAEKRIKGWTRKKKIALITKTNPQFRDLMKETD